MAGGQKILGTALGTTTFVKEYVAKKVNAWVEANVRPRKEEGLSKETTIAYRRLDELLTTKRGTKYGTTVAWMRCTLAFALLRSAIALLRSAISCIRGSRTSSCRTPNMNIELTIAESQLLYS